MKQNKAFHFLLWTYLQFYHSTSIRLNQDSDVYKMGLLDYQHVLIDIGNNEGRFNVVFDFNINIAFMFYHQLNVSIDVHSDGFYYSIAGYIPETFVGKTLNHISIFCQPSRVFLVVNSEELICIQVIDDLEPYPCYLGASKFLLNDYTRDVQISTDIEISPSATNICLLNYTKYVYEGFSRDFSCGEGETLQGLFHGSVTQTCSAVQERTIAYLQPVAACEQVEYVAEKGGRDYVGFSLPQILNSADVATVHFAGKRNEAIKIFLDDTKSSVEFRISHCTRAKYRHKFNSQKEYSLALIVVHHLPGEMIAIYLDSNPIIVKKLKDEKRTCRRAWRHAYNQVYYDYAGSKLPIKTIRSNDVCNAITMNDYNTEIMQGSLTLIQETMETSVKCKKGFVSSDTNMDYSHLSCIRSSDMKTVLFNESFMCESENGNDADISVRGFFENDYENSLKSDSSKNEKMKKLPCNITASTTKEE